VWVNQYRGDVIAAQAKGEMFLGLGERLHTDILAGQCGGYLIKALAC